MREGGRELSRGHTARMYFIVCFVCDGIALFERECSFCAHLAHQCSLMSTDEHFVLIRRFSLNAASRGPFSLLDHCGTSCGRSGWPRGFIVVDSAWFGTPSMRLAVLCFASAHRSARRLVFSTQPRLDSRLALRVFCGHAGGAVVSLFVSCFEFSAQMGAEVGLAYR